MASLPNGGPTPTKTRDPRLPPAGTVLTRHHNGIDHRVMVLEEGFEYQGGHTKTLTEGQPPQAPPPHEPVRRPARIAIMLALAHKIQTAIDRGVIRDRAEAARRLGFNRSRITQLFDLTQLAQDIQEEILMLESNDGIEPITERHLRLLLRSTIWAEQRKVWRRLRPTSETVHHWEISDPLEHAGMARSVSW